MAACCSMPGRGSPPRGPRRGGPNGGGGGMAAAVARRRAEHAALHDTPRINLAEGDAMIASVTARSDGRGMFVSEPRPSREGELRHWCQLYGDGTFRHGCTLGMFEHEQLGPPPTDARTKPKYVGASTVVVEAGEKSRTVDMSLGTWQLSPTALARRSEASDAPAHILPSDWMLAAPLQATLRTGCGGAGAQSGATLTIEGWHLVMPASMPSAGDDEETT